MSEQNNYINFESPEKQFYWISLNPLISDAELSEAEQSAKEYGLQ